MEKIRQTTEKITKQIGDELFFHLYSEPYTRFPSASEFVDDDLKIRLRRTVQSWKTDKLPSIVTHNLYDDGGDDVLNFLRGSNMLNHKDDKVKIVYHPDFVNSLSPLLGMEYADFVRWMPPGNFP